jgi:peptide deformylase
MNVEVIEQVSLPHREMMKGCPRGEVKPLVFYPNDMLAIQSQEVPQNFWGAKLDQLVADLVTTMYMCGGMGLSAVQVGIPLRVFVCDINASVSIAEAAEKKKTSQLFVAVNPVLEIVDQSESVVAQEGCLSFPGVHQPVTRPDRIVLTGRDRQGKAFKLPTGGVLSRIVQHEMDHLDGKTFLEYMGDSAKREAIQASDRFHKSVDKGTIRVGPGKVRPLKEPKKQHRQVSEKTKKRTRKAQRRARKRARG